MSYFTECQWYLFLETSLMTRQLTDYWVIYSHDILHHILLLRMNSNRVRTTRLTGCLKFSFSSVFLKQLSCWFIYLLCLTLYSNAFRSLTFLNIFRCLDFNINIRLCMLINIYEYLELNIFLYLFSALLSYLIFILIMQNSCKSTHTS